MKIDLAIGGGSSILATAIPDTALTLGGKLIFAVFTAVVASLVSRLVGALLDRRKKG